MSDPPSHPTATTRSPLYYGWVIVALAAAMQAVTSGGINSLYGVYAVPFSDTFELSRSQVMLGTASACLLFSGLFSPLAGLWLQRYSNRALILGSGGMLALGYLLLSQVTAFWQVTLVYMLILSVGNTLFGTLSANTSVSNWFVEGRGRALGFAAIGISVGSFVFPPLISWVIVDYSWRHAMVVMAVIVAATLLVMARYYIDGPAVEPAGMSRPPPMTVVAVLKNTNFWLIAAGISICFASFNGLMINLVPMAVDQGVSQQRASLLLSLAAVFGVAGKLLVGISADRMGARTALTLPLLSVCIACLILLGKPGFATMLVASAFIGLASGGSIPVWGALIGSFFGQRAFSLVMGLMNPMLVPLIVLCAPFVSWMNERYDTYDPALFTIIGFALAAMGLASMLKKP